LLALLFPGQGSQEVGMGRDVFEASPAARAVYETADAVLGLPLSKLCFEGPEEELRRTEIQQPALLATSIALLRALEEQAPLAPAYLLGHSLGEYSALVAGGALALEDAVALVHARGRFMQEAVPAGRGAMAAVLGLGAEAVAEACRAAAAETGGVVSPANLNAPEQIVIAGEAEAVARATALARAAGAKRCVALPVSAPFHCALMRPAAEKLAAELARVRFRAPAVPVLSNVEAEPNRDASRIPALLERQVTAPVRFVECVRRLVGLGVRRVIEVGPGSVLTGLVARIDRGVERANAATLAQLRELAAGAAPA
jgi:[acyl-carrier-protein] S-malonyltransferase